MQRILYARRCRGFTLVEVMVSTALIILIMALVASTVNDTQRVMTRTTTKVSQFQSARTAFDNMSRRLAQATLNTYYRAFDENTTAETAQYKYTRESELQFMTGPTAKIFTSPTMSELEDSPEKSYPGHAMFFMAPLGYTEELDTKVSSEFVFRFRNLSSALNGTGYFVENGEQPDAPKFLRDADAVPSRRRYRLMQLDIPTEQFTLYRRPLDSDVNNKYKIDPQILDVNQGNYLGMVDKNLAPLSGWKRPFWMRDALRRVALTGTKQSGHYRFANARPIAENVILLIVLPKLAPEDRVAPERIDTLAPYYMYDSWRVLAMDPASPLAAARYNQLPSMVQITMVAIDENSGARIAEHYGDNLPDWTKDLFDRVATEQGFRQEMDTLESRLIKDPTKPNYRIFSADIVLRASKWSKDTGIFLTNVPGTP